MKKTMKTMYNGLPWFFIEAKKLRAGTKARVENRTQEPTRTVKRVSLSSRSRLSDPANLSAFIMKNKSPFVIPMIIDKRDVTIEMIRSVSNWLALDAIYNCRAA